MRKEGIHVKLTEKWSKKYNIDGKTTKYRLWNKKNKLFCIKLIYDDSKDKYIFNISKSLENVDFMIGEIFDIPDFEFDKQYILECKNGNIKFYKNDISIKGEKAKKQIKKIFSYESIDYLIKDLFKGI